MRRRTLTLKLTRRPDGMWCKTINGRMQYFGPAGCDEETARRELVEFIRLMQTGHHRTTDNLATVESISDAYASSCKARIGKDMQERTWLGYEGAIGEFCKYVGLERIITTLGADDFAGVARSWRTKRGVHRCNNDIQAVRTMFKWAYENGLIQREPVYGHDFAKAPASQARMARFIKFKDSGQRKFSADELRKILGAATGQLRAMVLLGLNGGMYSVDVSDLNRADIVRDGRQWLIDTTRAKTGIPRKFVLWPETIRAIEAIPKNGDHVFTTRLGNPWNNRSKTDSVNLMFCRLLKSLGIKRRGVAFGAFRHTHVSAVGDHPDKDACHFTRGHIIPGITQHYDFPDAERLKSVSDLARQRLLGNVTGRRRAGKHASGRRSASRGRGGSSAAR